MIDRLLSEHRQIEAYARALVDVLDLSEPDLDRLKAARWELAKAMMQHLAFEDRYVCLPLEADPRPEVGGIARRLKEHLKGTQAAYETHTARWTGAAMAADWTGYRREARAQIDVLLDRIKLEEAELFPLIPMITASDGPSPAQHNWARAAWDVRASLDAA